MAFDSILSPGGIGGIGMRVSVGFYFGLCVKHAGVALFFFWGGSCILCFLCAVWSVEPPKYGLSGAALRGDLYRVLFWAVWRFNRRREGSSLINSGQSDV